MANENTITLINCCWWILFHHNRNELVQIYLTKSPSTSFITENLFHTEWLHCICGASASILLMKWKCYLAIYRYSKTMANEPNLWRNINTHTDIILFHCEILWKNANKFTRAFFFSSVTLPIDVPYFEKREKCFTHWYRTRVQLHSMHELGIVLQTIPMMNKFICYPIFEHLYKGYSFLFKKFYFSGERGAFVVSDLSGKNFT